MRRLYSIGMTRTAILALGVAAGTSSFGFVFTDLGDLAGGTLTTSGIYSLGERISKDGSTVIGYSISGNGVGGANSGEAFKWTLAGGMVGLGDLPTGAVYSRAFGVSADGSVIVGVSQADHPNNSTEPKNANEAFMWTSGGGMVGLGDPNDGGLGNQFFSDARAISGDGTIIVGAARLVTKSEPFMYNVGTATWTALDKGVAGDEGICYAANSNGSILAGWARDNSNIQGARWTGTTFNAIGDLPDPNFINFTISSQARQISPNGNIIVGTSTGSVTNNAFYWDINDLDPVNQMRALPEAPNATVGGQSFAWDVTDDGLTVVGWCHNGKTQISGSQNPARAIMWKKVGGNWISTFIGDWVKTGDLSGANITDVQDDNLSTFFLMTQALGISSDGSKLSGYGTKRFTPSGASLANYTIGWYLDIGTNSGLSGNIVLQDYYGDPASVSMTVEIEDATNTIVQTSNVNLNADGTYTLALGGGVVDGTYSVYLKPSHWLRKKVADVVVFAGKAFASASVMNGDVDGDNAVTIFDYSALSTHFDMDSSAATWNTVDPNTGTKPSDSDLDGDEFVSIFDYSILSTNFDQMGD